MVRELEYNLESERKLRGTLDELYSKTKQQMDNQFRIKHTSLLEIVLSKPNIITAIHSLKSNKGSLTPGIDGVTIRDYLLLSEEELVELLQDRIQNFKAQKSSVCLYQRQTVDNDLLVSQQLRIELSNR